MALAGSRMPSLPIDDNLTDTAHPSPSALGRGGPVVSDREKTRSRARHDTTRHRTAHLSHPTPVGPRLHHGAPDDALRWTRSRMRTECISLRWSPDLRDAVRLDTQMRA